MKVYSFTDIVNRLVDSGLFTREELQLLIDINGNNTGTLNDALYARYGYYINSSDIEQIIYQ